MALNSMIRKIPLLGNCDLTNFHSDIHDYEGFETDNSLFLNKRKVNWWTRQADNSEFSGLHALINGDYFDIYRGTTKLGHISRNYYKLESVSATEYRNHNLSRCENPYPQSKNWSLIYRKGIPESFDTLPGLAVVVPATTPCPPPEPVFGFQNETRLSKQFVMKRVVPFCS